MLKAAVAVIDKTDCIMKNINILISFQLLDHMYWVDSMGSSHYFHLSSKQGSVFYFIISTFNHSQYHMA